MLLPPHTSLASRRSPPAGSLQRAIVDGLLGGYAVLLSRLNGSTPKISHNVWIGLLRWTAAGVLEAEKRFRRVNGYRDLQLLRAALERTLPSGETPAATVA